MTVMGLLFLAGRTAWTSMSVSGKSTCGTPTTYEKLSEGDMTATEAKYHKKCLTELYNIMKLKRNDEKSEKELFTIVEGNE